MSVATISLKNNDLSPAVLQFIKSFVPTYRGRQGDVCFSNDLTAQRLLEVAGRQNPIYILLNEADQSFDPEQDVFQSELLGDQMLAEETLERARMLSEQGGLVIHITSKSELDYYLDRFKL